MAKIGFLTDRSPADSDPFSTLIWNQFRALAESQHDVLVVSNRPAPEDPRWRHARLQVIEPFNTWSVRFLPRFLQILAMHKPDVLHWIEPTKPKFNHLQWVSPALAGLRKRPLLAMTLWNPESWEKSWLVSGTIPTMDLLFVNHPLHRELLWQKYPQIISRVLVAPLIFDREPNSLHWVNTWANEFDFIPGDLAHVRDFEEVLEVLSRSLSANPDRKAIIPMSSREDRFHFLERLRDKELDARVAVFENLDWATWTELLSRSRQIRTDVLKLKSPYVSLAIQWGRSNRRSIQLSTEQQRLLTEAHWQDATNFLGRAYQAAFKEKEARIH